MTIRERIFVRLDEMKMTQKEFAKRTGISPRAISEWKTKKTNPTADKIMIICQVLEVSPEWLLSGVDKEGKRGNNRNLLVIDKNTEEGELVTEFGKLKNEHRQRLLGYMYALSELTRNMSREEKDSLK